MTPAIFPSQKSPRYFQQSTGAAFIPIGPNLAFQRFLDADDEDAVFARFTEQFQKLAAAGGNFARVWLGVPFFNIEPVQEGVFDDRRCQRLRKLADLASEFGIQLKLTLEHFRTLEHAEQKEIFFGAATFTNLVHRPENGGSCLSMEEFLNSQNGRRAFLRKLDRIAEALDGANNIWIVELWNEFNAVSASRSAWRDWTVAMLPELRARFPRSLVTQSLGSFDSPDVFTDYDWLCSLQANDFKQFHRYLDQQAKLDVCHGALDCLCADAVSWLLAHGLEKPVIMAEAGAVEPGHSGPSKLYPFDTEGVMLHDILFAPFFAGAAGPGQCWHWDYYLEKNNLWYHYGRLAKALEGVDPVEEDFRPFQVPHARLLLYGLKGKRTTLLWCRDPSSDWESELVRGIPAPELCGLELEAASLQGAIPQSVYRPWSDDHAPVVRQADGSFLLPPFRRSVVVKALSDSSGQSKLAVHEVGRPQKGWV